VLRTRTSIVSSSCGEQAHGCPIAGMTLTQSQHGIPIGIARSWRSCGRHAGMKMAGVERTWRRMDKPEEKSEMDRKSRPVEAKLEPLVGALRPRLHAKFLHGPPPSPHRRTVSPPWAVARARKSPGEESTRRSCVRGHRCCHNISGRRVRRTAGGPALRNWPSPDRLGSERRDTVEAA
jgi:hypothetical protein